MPKIAASGVSERFMCEILPRSLNPNTREYQLTVAWMSETDTAT